MKMQTPTSAAGERRYVRRVSAAIERRRDASVTRRRGRFSTGSEQRPDTPAKLRLGRYSHGAEQLPDSPGKLRIGRFSTGIEQRPDTPDKLRRGSFADGYAASRWAGSAGCLALAEVVDKPAGEHDADLAVGEIVPHVKAAVACGVDNLDRAALVQRGLQAFDAQHVAWFDLVVVGLFAEEQRRDAEVD